MDMKRLTSTTPITEVPILKYGLPTIPLRILKQECDSFKTEQATRSADIENLAASDASIKKTISRIINRISDNKFVGKTIDEAHKKVDGLKLQKNNLDTTAAETIRKRYDVELEGLKEFSEKLTELKKAGYDLGRLPEQFEKNLKLAQGDQKGIVSCLENCKKTSLPGQPFAPVKPAEPKGIRKYIPFSNYFHQKKLNQYKIDDAVYKTSLENYNGNYAKYINTNENFINSMNEYIKNISVSRNIKNAISADVNKITHNTNLIKGNAAKVKQLKEEIAELGNVLKARLTKKGLTGTVEDITKQLEAYYKNPDGFLGAIRGTTKRIFNDICIRPVIFKDMEFIRPLIRMMLGR